MKPLIGILVTVYNEDPITLNRMLGSVYQQEYPNLFIVCVDDGSTVSAAGQIRFHYSDQRLSVVRIPHSERAVARAAGIAKLKERGCAFFLFIDGDMVLPSGFIQNLSGFASSHAADGYVIPEESFSEHRNFWTRVKVFERNLYQAGRTINQSSIEAARFWRMDRFSGFDPKMKAFEEIQPTLKCLKDGGTVLKYGIPLLHDEKRVTYASLFRKKGYYFTDMSANSFDRVLEMIKRFYFFRTQLYHFRNLLNYLKHPVLASAVFAMYLLLTFTAVHAVLSRKRGG